MHFVTKLLLLFLSFAWVQSQVDTVKVNELNTVVSLFQSERSLSDDQLSRLQNEIFTTVLMGLRNNYDIHTLAENLEKLVQQYAARIQIDWLDFSQSIINDVASVLLNILSSTPGGLTYEDNQKLQLLSQLPTEKYEKILRIVHNSDRTTARIKIQELLCEFFFIQQTRSNFDDIAADMLDHLNHILPQLKAPLVE